MNAETQPQVEREPLSGCGLSLLHLLIPCATAGLGVFAELKLITLIWRSQDYDLSGQHGFAFLFGTLPLAVISLGLVAILLSIFLLIARLNWRGSLIVSASVVSLAVAITCLVEFWRLF